MRRLPAGLARGRTGLLQRREEFIGVKGCGSASASRIGAGVPARPADLRGAGHQPGVIAQRVTAISNIAVHFHGHAARQRARAHRGAGMPAGIAEHRHEQVGRAIGDFRLLGHNRAWR